MRRIVTAGVISGTYLENLTSFPDVEVCFVADLDRERARAAAERHGVARFGSVDELLASAEIEIIVNLTIPAVTSRSGTASSPQGSMSGA